MVIKSRQRHAAFGLMLCAGLLAFGAPALAAGPEGAFAMNASAGEQAPSNRPDDRDETYNQALDADPLESVNRPLYKVNYVFDKCLLRPVAVGYRATVPQFGRNMVSNFLGNLYSPVVFTNSVLQGDPQNSFATLFRFIINSTFGIGGLFDVAGSGGLHNRPADFGETLAFYGVQRGPFLFLPILGPSDIRDGVGDLADAFINPLPYISNTADYAYWGATAVDYRSKEMKLIDNVYTNSLDPYVTFRSLYLQKRMADIRRAKASRQQALDNQANRYNTAR